MSQQITLAEALLRRKQLAEKVRILGTYKDKDFFEIRAKRVPVADGLDDVVANVPKLTASQFTAEYDWHARKLREIDAVIQQTNWVTTISVTDDAMLDYPEVHAMRQAAAAS